MPNDIIDISNVDFAYRDVLVLKDVSLRIEAGTTLGLIGPNGGGKTTLIRLLLGLLQPTRGSVHVDGHEPRAAVQRGDVIGYLPEPEVSGEFSDQRSASGAAGPRGQDRHAA